MAYLSKNLALEKPQAITWLDNVLDSHSTNSLTQRGRG
jgi:hypothetical protein